MKPSRAARLLSLAIFTATIAACGGGGGGGSNDPVANVPPPPPPPPAPETGRTGLTDPSLQLSTSTAASSLAGSFGQIAREMLDAYEVADGSAAGTELSKIAANIGTSGTVACAGGGSFTITGSGTTLTFASCATAGYTFTGTASVRPLAPDPGYQVTYAGVSATGPNGFNEAISGVSSCILDPDAKCVTKLGGFMWGYDSTYLNGIANGTHQCTCANGSWNVLFDDFGPASGIAYVYANNGTAVVTRTGAKTFLVQQTLTGGTTTPAFPVTLQ